MSSSTARKLISGILAATCMGFLCLLYMHEGPAKRIDAFMQAQNFHGAVLIAKGDQVLFKGAYGLANREHAIPNSPQTVFRIGSVTKQLTAVAILLLQEQGKLNVSDPLSKYLPTFPNGENITLHHLLSHSSGIATITDLPHFASFQLQPTTPLKTITQYQQLQPHFPPGSDCEYSDPGYIILGAIIEIASGKSYEEYLRESIFAPLGMSATTIDQQQVIIPQRAAGYAINKNDQIIPAGYIDMSFPHAAGALVSTVEDLYKFNRALQNNTLLSPASLKALFSIQASNASRKIAYSYGFRIGPQNRFMEECDSSVIGHFGSIEGFEAASLLYADGLMIILLSNVEKTPVRSMHIALAQLAHGHWRR